MSTLPLGFQALGLQDSEYLRNSLVNCEDPLKAIADFQEENSVLLPTLKSALNLLDLHNVRRLDFHSSIADELKEQLTKKIEELSSSLSSNYTSKEQYSEDLKKLEDLLEKSFPLIFMPRLQPLIFLIMKGLPKINESYLNVIKENEGLYSIVPINVKRQLWSSNTDVFMKELEPHFDKFIALFDETMTYMDFSLAPHLHTTCLGYANIDQATKETILLSNNIYVSFFKHNKRHLTHLNEICKLIGTSARLYELTVSNLSNIYLKNRDWFYSTLRIHLLIRLTEMHNHETLQTIVASGGAATSSETPAEMTLRFFNIITGCLKEKTLGTKRAKELESIMESKKFEKIIPDVAFILADPFVIDFLARSTMYHLNKCIQTELLPRNCSELIFVLRLLSMSLLSWEIIDTQANKEPKMDSTLITEYLPNLAYFLTDFYEKLYDDALNLISQTSTPSLLSSSAAASTNILTSIASVPTTPPKPLVSSTTSATSTSKSSPPIVLKISTKKIEIISSIKTQVQENELCSVLLLYLIIACLEINDWVNLKVLLASIKYPNNNPALFEKWFLFQFFNYMAEKNIIEQFKHDWFVNMIFDEFLFVVAKQKEDQHATLEQSGSLYINSTVFYEQLYKLLDKLYPSQLSQANFTRLVEWLKPKKIHSSSIHIAYLKVKSKLEMATN